MNKEEATEEAVNLAGGAVGTAAGVTGSAAVVSAAGSVAGLSGAGIVSGLAAIGFGSMLGGVLIIAGSVSLVGYGGSVAARKIYRHFKNKARTILV